MVITRPPGYKLYTHLFHSAIGKLNYKIIKYYKIKKCIEEWKMVITQPPGYKLYTHLFHSAIEKLNYKIIKYYKIKKCIEEWEENEACDYRPPHSGRNITPTGFAKPSLISEELCKFLNKPSGTLMARTEVTQKLNKYIKEHSLQNPANMKEIKADTALTKLLNLKKGDDLTYFSLQKYLKDHFLKNVE